MNYHNVHRLVLCFCIALTGAVIPRDNNQAVDIISHPAVTAIGAVSLVGSLAYYRHAHKKVKALSSSVTANSPEQLAQQPSQKSTAQQDLDERSALHKARRKRNIARGASAAFAALLGTNIAAMITKKKSSEKPEKKNPDESAVAGHIHLPPAPPPPVPTPGFLKKKAKDQGKVSPTAPENAAAPTPKASPPPPLPPHIKKRKAPDSPREKKPNPKTPRVDAPAAPPAPPVVKSKHRTPTASPRLVSHATTASSPATARTSPSIQSESPRKDSPASSRETSSAHTSPSASPTGPTTQPVTSGQTVSLPKENRWSGVFPPPAPAAPRTQARPSAVPKLNLTSLTVRPAPQKNDGPVSSRTRSQCSLPPSPSPLPDDDGTPDTMDLGESDSDVPTSPPTKHDAWHSPSPSPKATTPPSPADDGHAEPMQISPDRPSLKPRALERPVPRRLKPLQHRPLPPQAEQPPAPQQAPSSPQAARPPASPLATPSSVPSVVHADSSPASSPVGNSPSLRTSAFSHVSSELQRQSPIQAPPSPQVPTEEHDSPLPIPSAKACSPSPTGSLSGAVELPPSPPMVSNQPPPVRPLNVKPTQVKPKTPPPARVSPPAGPTMAPGGPLTQPLQRKRHRSTSGNRQSRRPRRAPPAHSPSAEELAAPAQEAEPPKAPSPVAPTSQEIAAHLKEALKTCMGITGSLDSPRDGGVYDETQDSHEYRSSERASAEDAPGSAITPRGKKILQRLVGDIADKHLRPPVAHPDAFVDRFALILEEIAALEKQERAQLEKQERAQAASRPVSVTELAGVKPLDRKLIADLCTKIGNNQELAPREAGSEEANCAQVLVFIDQRAQASWLHEQIKAAMTQVLLPELNPESQKIVDTVMTNLRISEERARAHAAQQKTEQEHAAIASAAATPSLAPRSRGVLSQFEAELAAQRGRRTQTVDVIRPHRSESRSADVHNPGTYPAGRQHMPGMHTPPVVSSYNAPYLTKEEQRRRMNQHRRAQRNAATPRVPTMPTHDRQNPYRRR